MTAPVRIEALAWGDLRFATLARLCGFTDADHALIKCSKIWSWQTEHYTDDAPTYVVDAELIESAIGTDGAERMVRARLAEAVPEGYRIKGSKDRIEWLWKLRKASIAGGEATKRKHADKDRPHGQPTATPSARPSPGPNPGPLPPDLAPDRSKHEDSLAAPAPAIPRDQRKTLRDGAWARVNAKRAEFPGSRALNLHDPGYSELAARILESGADAQANVEHVLEIAFAEADTKRTPEFLTGSMFEQRSWSKKLSLRLQDVSRPRAGPRRTDGALIGAASPRTDHPESDRLIPLSELLP